VAPGCVFQCDLTRAMSDAADPTRRLDLLLSPAGQELLGQLGGAVTGAADELRLGKRLRRDYPADLVAAVIGLLELRQRGLAKFTRAAEMYFTRSGLEQASAEVVARHHARRYAAFGQVADLCCGIGGDLVALAACSAVVGVDNDTVHAQMAELNARVCGVDADLSVWVGDVRDAVLDGVEAVFVDPTRRIATRRLRAGLSEPPLAWCFGLGPRVGIKAAPGLPLELVPEGWEIEFVADGRELKEALLWSPGLRTCARRATVLPRGDTLVGAAGAERDVPVAVPGGYLLDPNPAATRAGLVEDLARSLDAWKIDRLVGFLSAEHALVTPFGRCLRIEASLPWNLKQVRGALRELDVGTLDIRKRGSPVDVEDLQRRLKPGGARAAMLVLTRVLDRPWALICSDA
jgi:THUMP domain-like/RNA cap guanine-N2 methyltransferase